MEYNKLSIFYLVLTQKECFRLPFELSFERFSLEARARKRIDLLQVDLTSFFASGASFLGREFEAAKRATKSREVFVPRRIISDEGLIG